MKAFNKEDSFMIQTLKLQKFVHRNVWSPPLSLLTLLFIIMFITLCLLFHCENMDMYRHIGLILSTFFHKSTQPCDFFRYHFLHQMCSFFLTPNTCHFSTPVFQFYNTSWVSNNPIPCWHYLPRVSADPTFSGLSLTGQPPLQTSVQSVVPKWHTFLPSDYKLGVPTTLAPH